MSTQPVTREQMQLVFAKRRKCRGTVYQHFLANIGKRYASYKLHLPTHLGGFGSAVRTRISEINLDVTAAIFIENEVEVDEQGNELSVYYAVAKVVAQ